MARRLSDQLGSFMCSPPLSSSSNSGPPNRPITNHTTSTYFAFGYGGGIIKTFVTVTFVCMNSDHSSPCKFMHFCHGSFHTKSIDNCSDSSVQYQRGEIRVSRTSATACVPRNGNSRPGKNISSCVKHSQAYLSTKQLPSPLCSALHRPFAVVFVSRLCSSRLH